ncbi:MAG: MFS transporter [Candidatus Omnitrophota bacterium]
MIKFIADIRNRNFMRLWWAQLISQFGDRVSQMALIGMVYELSGKETSAMGLAKLLSFTIIPVFIIGPVAGVFVDRWDRQRTLFICDIARSLLVLTIPFIFMRWESMIPTYIVVFLMFCFSRFHVPAKMSIIPKIVKAEHLVLANSMMTSTGMIAFVSGAWIGGFLVEWFGARGGFLVDSLTYLVSAGLVFSMARGIHRKISKEELVRSGREILRLEKSFWREMKDGIVYLFSKREIRFIINALFILMSAAGAVYVVIIVFIQQAFGSVTRHLGVLAVTLGAGLFIGVLLYGRYGKRFPWHKTIFFCLTLGGLMMLAFVWGVSRWPNVWFAFSLSLALGAVIGPIFIASNTVVHQVADEEMQGKVFSLLEIVIHFAFLVAMLISSWLSEIVSPGSILSAVALVFSGVGVFGLIRYRTSSSVTGL